MSKQREYKPFTPEQLKLIKDNDKVITLTDLGKKLGINYTNLSGALKKFRITFNPKKKVSKQLPSNIKATMTKKYDEFGQELVTDELMKIWSYSNNQVN